MELLYIEPSEFTPRVSFDPVNSVFELSGFSRPENVVSFYKPILKWLADYNELVLSRNPGKTTITVKFQMTYFNSASSKFILDILLDFIKFSAAGHQVNINWYYDEDDDEILESGEEISAMINYAFNFIPVTPNA